MASGLSPKSFSSQLRERLLQLHWRQWSTLGVSGQVGAKSDRAIDLEALVVSTLALGLADQRLLVAMFEWLVRNGPWANRSRLNRIARSFAAAGPDLLPSPALDALSRAVGSFTISVRPHQERRPDSDADWRHAAAFKVRRVIGKPRIQQPALLQLALRGLFGMDVRADVFLYLLHSQSGSSLSIARKVYCDQKSAYTVLERWRDCGVVTRTDRGYMLTRKREWRQLLNLPETTEWINWPRTLLLFDRLALAVSDDAYLLSSAFRDLAPGMDEVARSVGTSLPTDARLLGVRYFPPFAAAVLEIIERLQ